LEAYHQRVLDEERQKSSRPMKGNMASTDFNTEKLDAESVDAASKRVAAMFAVEHPAVTNLPLDQALGVSPAPASEPTEKKQRTTVAKLAQRYQEREAELAKNIDEIKRIIGTYQRTLAEAEFKLSVWREALAEIGAD